jgi:hypothetical protein
MVRVSTPVTRLLKADNVSGQPSTADNVSELLSYNEALRLLA